MRTYRLLRLEDTGTECRGILVEGARFVAQTLERPWIGNERGISCIPTGTYTATWHRSPSKGYSYHINDVPGRSGVLIHAGNTVGDTEGCILLGQVISTLGDRPAVGRSRAAIAQFHEDQAPEPFRLIVLKLTQEA